MIEEQPTDVARARTDRMRHTATTEIPLEQWEGEGGAIPPGETGAAPSKGAATAVGTRVAPPADPPGSGESDPDAITERHVFG
jgi:hypothetical protein